MPTTRASALVSTALFVCVAHCIGATSATGIGLKDLKQKASDKAKEAVEKKIEVAAPVDSTAEPGGAPGASTSGDGASAGAGPATKVSQVSNKYDFVPGDKVIYADDFSADELGEFPARLRLVNGNFDVVEFEGKHWFRLAGDRGDFQMKGAAAQLPERWTLEFDLHADEGAAVLEVVAPGAGGWEPWWIHFGPHGNNVLVMANKQQSYSTLSKGDLGGHHHVAFMAQGKSLKIYIDQDRVANVPEIEEEIPPGTLTLRMGAPSVNPKITNLRFAEKSVPKKDLLAEGPFVTHGIYFDSGSDRVRPESAPVLRQIATYLAANADVRIRISGHTDDVGADSANLDLSARRAASVAATLSTEFAIDAGRMETEGKGESAPMAANDSAEGRATNRRVEFTKL